MEDSNLLASASLSKIKWVENLWQKWIQSKQEEDPEFFGASIPSYFKMGATLACQYLAMFIAEVKNEKGEEYHPSTLHSIILTIQIIHFQVLSRASKAACVPAEDEFDSDSTLEYEMTQIEEPQVVVTNMFAGAVFNNCTINLSK